MYKFFICKNCHKHLRGNPRLKGNQKYCGAKECQKVRKRKWQKEKMQTGKDYGENQRESVRQWQRNYPLDQYQQEYRQANPEYVKRNREQQKERNKKIKTLKNIEKFVNQKKSDLEKCNMNNLILKNYNFWLIFNIVSE